jgi:hypothetical protein
MRLAPTPGALAWATLCLSLASNGCDGCSRSKAGDSTTRPAIAVAPNLTQPAEQPTVLEDGAALPKPAQASTHEPLEYDGAPIEYTVTRAVEGGGAAPDPDDAVVQAARQSGGRCFAGLTEGPDVRTATITVTVVPTGRVTRTEVRADGDEPELLDCLHRVGDNLSFKDLTIAAPGTRNSTTEDIRSVSIDIAVARSH